MIGLLFVDLGSDVGDGECYLSPNTDIGGWYRLKRENTNAVLRACLMP
jgi:hypothetical protein